MTSLVTRAVTQVSDTQIEQFFHVFSLSRGQRFWFLKFFFWYLNIISLEENMQNLNKISLKLTVFTRHSSKLCSRVEGPLKGILKESGQIWDYRPYRLSFIIIWKYSKKKIWKSVNGGPSYGHLHFLSFWQRNSDKLNFFFFLNFFRILIFIYLSFRFFWIFPQLAVNDPRSGQFSDTQWVLTPMATSKVIYGQLRQKSKKVEH